MRRAVFGQKWRDILGVGGVYKELFDSRQAVFVHIPKTAGSSLSNCIFGKSPWHYTAAELKFINRKKFNAYYKFAFVRDPWERLYSAYVYSAVDDAKFRNSPLGFIAKYNTFEEFVGYGLNEDLVNSHYFFWPQHRYVCDEDGGLLVDFLGKFEHLHEEFNKLSNQIGLAGIELPHLNVSKNGEDPSGIYSEQMHQKVSSLYRKDISLFGY